MPQANDNRTTTPAANGRSAWLEPGIRFLAWWFSFSASLPDGQRLYAKISERAAGEANARA